VCTEGNSAAGRPKEMSESKAQQTLQLTVILYRIDFIKNCLDLVLIDSLNQISS